MLFMSSSLGFFSMATEGSHPEHSHPSLPSSSWHPFTPSQQRSCPGHCLYPKHTCPSQEWNVDASGPSAWVSQPLLNGDLDFSPAQGKRKHCRLE